MTITGNPTNLGANTDVTFDAGSTFVAALDGSTNGTYTNLTDNDVDPSTGSTIELNGSNLAAELGPGFAPSVGEQFTIISTPHGTIDGRFANASPGLTVTLSGLPYLVTYNKVAGKVTSIELTVQAITTTITVSLAPGSSNPSTQGQSVTFVATVAGGSATPTGSVMFFDGQPGSGGTQIGATQTLSGGQASVTVSTLPVGSRAIYAVYQPSGPFSPITSAAYNETVKAQPREPRGNSSGNPNPDTTVTSLSSSANPSNPGQPLTFTATVTASGGPVPGGDVTFMQGATILGTVPLTGGGTATLTTSALPPGSDPITASYGGSSVRQVLLGRDNAGGQPLRHHPALTLISKKVKHRKVFELEARVTTNVAGGSAPLPVGTVIFLRKSSSIGSAALQGGSAVFPIGGSRPREQAFHGDVQRQCRVCAEFFNRALLNVAVSIARVVSVWPMLSRGGSLIPRA